MILYSLIMNLDKKLKEIESKGDIVVHFFATIYEKGQREVNQDSIALHKIHTQNGEALLAVVCDGMGGMDQGEIASGYTVQELSKWFYQEFAQYFAVGKNTKIIKRLLMRQLFSIHEQLLEYGVRKKIHCGTTMTMFLTWDNNYLIASLGDSMAYRIERKIKTLTIAQSRGNQLYGCIGIGRFVPPRIVKGRLHGTQAFFLMSDGLGHYASKDDLLRMLTPYEINTEQIAQKRLSSLVNQLMARGEEDNMSAIYLRY